jgi:outer membrane immunogenic protein
LFIQGMGVAMNKNLARYTLLKVTALAVVVAGVSPVFAADLPPPPPPPRAPAAYIPVAPPPVYSWTGFYLGPNIGWGWNSVSVTDSSGLNYNNSTNQGQFAGGGQVGFNYQFWGGVVLGVEADFDWLPNSSNTGNGTVVPAAAGDTIKVTGNNRWLTDVTGRLGYGFDTVLVYGKGGWAWVGSSNNTLTNVTTGATFTGSGSSSNDGWVAGAGVEWAFWGNLSAKVEYDYIRLNNTSFTVPAGTLSFTSADTFNISNRSINIVQLGLNYKFGGGW